MTREWSHSEDVWDDGYDDSNHDRATELDGFVDYRPIDDDSEDDWFTESDDNRALSADDSDETVETLLVTAASPVWLCHGDWLHGWPGVSGAVVSAGDANDRVRTR